MWKERKKGYEFLVKGYLFVIFYYFFNKGYIIVGGVDREFDLKFEKIKFVFDYINFYYLFEFDIDLFVKFVNLSKFYFCCFFKEIIYFILVDYINKFRVEKVIEFIKNINMSIFEIVFEVGFNNVSYFIKVFKEYVGIILFKYKKNIL